MISSEEVLKIAQECGICMYESNDQFIAWEHEIERFAAAMYEAGAAAERAVSDKLLEALQNFVRYSHEQDIGGGDLVVATCESREKAVAIIDEVETMRKGQE